MTVNELQDMLDRYDGEREVVIGGVTWSSLAGVRSIEPRGSMCS